MFIRKLDVVMFLLCTDTPVHKLGIIVYVFSQCTSVGLYTISVILNDLLKDGCMQWLKHVEIEHR